MANVNGPSGFSPVQYLNGAPWSGQARMYSIDASYGTALYIGDPVKSGGGADANGIPNIVLGSTTGGLRGVIVGVGKTIALAGHDTVYKPASDPAVWYAMVVDDPAVLFEIQEESNGTQIAAAEIGLNTISKSGSGAGSFSGWQLPSVTGATPATTATLQLKLMGLVLRSNNAFGAYAKHLVQINVHELAHGTGSLGV